MKPDESALSEDRWDEIAARMVPGKQFDESWKSTREAESDRWRMHRLLGLASNDSSEDFTRSVLSKILTEQENGIREKPSQKILTKHYFWIPAAFAACLALLAYVAWNPGEDEGIVREGNQMVLKVDRGKTRLTGGQGTRFSEAADHTAKEKHYRLERGTLSLKVGKQPGSLRVSTQHLTAKVIGTAFDVVTAADHTRVAVSEGQVRVNPHRHRVSPLLLHRNEGVNVSEDRVVREVTASLFQTPPTIDGELDTAWSRLYSHALPRTNSNEPTNWKIGWDDHALFLLVEVKDEAVIAAGDRSPFHGDCVEVFLDGDHSRASSYDGVDDFEVFFPIKMQDPTGNKFSPKQHLPEIEMASATTAEGYRLEARIPFSLLKVSPLSGLSLGFDLAVNDQDSIDPKADRQSRDAWNDQSQKGWFSPAHFGTLILGE